MSNTKIAELSKSAVKDKKGKPRAGLVLGDFAKALIEVSKVGTAGTYKYSDSGWLEEVNGEEAYFDALIRHALACKASGDFDPTYGLLHSAHLAWNALAFLSFQIERLDTNPESTFDEASESANSGEEYFPSKDEIVVSKIIGGDVP